MSSASSVFIVIYGVPLRRARSLFRRSTRDVAASISHHFERVTQVLCLAPACRGSNKHMHLCFPLTRSLCCESYRAILAVTGGYNNHKDPS